MCKRIGTFCVFLGVLCILSAIGFVAYNQWEDKNAEVISQDILENVQSIIKEPKPEIPPPDNTVNLPDDTEKVPAEMATVEVDGYERSRGVAYRVKVEQRVKLRHAVVAD